MIDSDFGCCGRSGNVYLISLGRYIFHNEEHMPVKCKQFLVFVCLACHSTLSRMWKVSTLRCIGAKTGPAEETLGFSSIETQWGAEDDTAHYPKGKTSLWT